jgi:hypothetical protein|tara:strand:+ start:1029 stop:1325 length:297 start_codon:yes stop_codon:yes gene_type:complete
MARAHAKASLRSNHSLVKLGFKLDSSTHSMLRLARTMRSRITAADVLHVLAGKFDSRTKVERSAQTLLKWGYIEPLRGGGWAITSAGCDILIVTTKEY